jgi:hypothetical protein
LGFVLRPLSRTRFFITNANSACSCVYICKFQFRPIHPPSRRLSESRGGAGAPGTLLLFSVGLACPEPGGERRWRRDGRARRVARSPRSRHVRTAPRRITSTGITPSIVGERRATGMRGGARAGFEGSRCGAGRRRKERHRRKSRLLDSRMEGCRRCLIRGWGIRGRDSRKPRRGWPSKEARHRRKLWLLDSRTARNQPLLDPRVEDPRAGFEGGASAPSKEAARMEGSAGGRREMAGAQRVGKTAEPCTTEMWTPTIDS